MAIVFNAMFVVVVAVAVSAFPSPAQLSGDASGVETNTHDPTELLNLEAETFPLTGVVMDPLNRNRRSHGGYGRYDGYESNEYESGSHVSYGRNVGGYGNYGGAAYGGSYSGGRRGYGK